VGPWAAAPEPASVEVEEHIQAADFSRSAEDDGAGFGVQPESFKNPERSVRAG